MIAHTTHSGKNKVNVASSDQDSIYPAILVADSLYDGGLSTFHIENMFALNPVIMSNIPFDLDKNYLLYTSTERAYFFAVAKYAQHYNNYFMNENDLLSFMYLYTIHINSHSSFFEELTKNPEVYKRYKYIYKKYRNISTVNNRLFTLFFNMYKSLSAEDQDSEKHFLLQDVSIMIKEHFYSDKQKYGLSSAHASYMYIFKYIGERFGYDIFDYNLIEHIILGAQSIDLNSTMNFILRGVNKTKLLLLLSNEDLKPKTIDLIKSMLNSTSKTE